MLKLFILTLFIFEIEGRDIIVTLVKNGKPEAPIVIGKRASSREKFAAMEIRRYIKKITGAELKIKRVGPKDLWALLKWEDFLVIGRVPTNPLLKELHKKKLFFISKDFPKYDGFMIKNVWDENRNYMIFTSNITRGVIYAVYYFLEKLCGVGFFPDGERVPKKKDLWFRNLNILESPRFKLRLVRGDWLSYPIKINEISAGRCKSHREGWEEFLQWLAKLRFNRFSCFGNNVIAIKRRSFREVGLKLPPIKEERKRIIQEIDLWKETFEEIGLKFPSIEVERRRGDLEINLWRAIRKYIREILGWKIYCEFSTSLVEVDKRFVKKNRDIEYVSAEIDGGERFWISPYDSVFSKLVYSFFKNWQKAYGKITEFLITIDFPPSFTSKTSEETFKIYKCAITEVINATTKINPYSRVIFLPLSWPEKIPKEKLLSILTPDVVICDPWSDGEYSYKKDYDLANKRWIFVSRYGVSDRRTLIGNLASLESSVREVGINPIYKSCIGISPFNSDTPSPLYYNPLFVEMCKELMWDPKSFNIDNILRSYSIRRYGKDASLEMLEFLRPIYQNIYIGGNPRENYPDRFGMMPSGVHLYRLTDFKEKPAKLVRGKEEILKRFKSINPHFMKAIESGLEQKPQLIRNEFYVKDLISTTHSYFVWCLDNYLVGLYKCFSDKNVEGFENRVKIINALLDGIEKILSLMPDYSLNHRINMFKTKGLDAEKKLKMKCLVEPYDSYEFFKLCCKRRVEKYVEFLTRKIKGSEKINFERELFPIYKSIENRFLRSSFVLKSKYPSLKESVETVEKTYLEIKGLLEELRIKEVVSPEAVKREEIKDVVVNFPMVLFRDDKTILIDVSKPRKNGKIHGAKWERLKIKFGLNFDGKDDYVELPQLLTGIHNNFMIKVWVKPTSLNPNSVIFHNCCGDRDIKLWIDDLGKVYFKISATDGRKITIASPEGSITPDEFYQIVAIYADEEMRLYIDAEEVASVERKFDVDWSDGYVGAAIGANVSPLKFGFHGIITNFKISKVVATEEEIRNEFKRLNY